MVHRDRASVPTGGVADATAVAITLQHSFTETAEVCFVLPVKRVAGRAKAMREDLRAAAAA